MLDVLFVSNPRGDFVSHPEDHPVGHLKRSASGLIVFLVVIGLVVWAPACACAQWKLAWSDEFSGPAGAAPDSAKWKFESGNHDGWGNHEREHYCAPGVAGQSGCDMDHPNVRLDGAGNLIIEARKETSDGRWTSGRMSTRESFTQAYGRFEARIKLPVGQGLWPAFWLLGANIQSAGWPGCGEIDIMENVGNEPSKVHGTLHGPGYSGAHPLTSSYALPAGQTFADAFHVFAVEWEPNVVRFYVDDVLYETQTPANLPTGAKWVYDHPFFILLNFAVGGNWPKDPDETTPSSAVMLVDYVRAYARK